MDALPDTLDVICSSRTTSAQRSTALSRLEYLIASVCVPRNAQETPRFHEFLKSQVGFESNIPSRLLIWIASATGHLEVLLSRGSNLDQDKQDESKTIASQLIQALGVIQGVALNHRPTKAFLGRRYSLEILVDLLLVSRHAGSSPLEHQQSSRDLSSSTSSKDGRKNSESESPSKKHLSQSPPQLASAVLDTLLCILVDSSEALRAFEEAKGVQIAVKILKRAGTPREVRMKCLEFLYFYLLDEHSFVVPSSTQRRTGSESSLPLSFPPSITTATPATSPLKASFGESISGKSDVGNSNLASGGGGLLPAFSLSPKSRAAQSNAPTSPFEVSLRASASQRFHERLEKPPSLNSSSSSSASNWDSSPGKLGSAFMPTSSTSNSTSAPNNIFPPPESHPVSHRPRTPPRSNSAPQNSRMGTGPSSKQLTMIQKELEFGPITPKKAQISGLGKGAAPSLPSRSSSNFDHPPRPILPSRSSTSASTSTSDTSNPPSTGVSSTASTNQRPSLGTRMSSSGLNGVNGGRSPRRYRDAETGRIMVSPRSEKEKENKAQLRHGLGISGLSGIRAGSIVKSTEEKKELLGSMLGNVDALVEGVKKAGIWGLG